MDLKKTTKNHFGSFSSDQIAFCPIILLYFVEDFVITFFPSFQPWFKPLILCDSLK